MAIVEVIYREPERDGKPYFNRMIVSYVLEKTDGQWYFIKDHASSVEKSTDVQGGFRMVASSISRFNYLISSYANATQKEIVIQPVADCLLVEN